MRPLRVPIIVTLEWKNSSGGSRMDRLSNIQELRFRAHRPYFSGWCRRLRARCLKDGHCSPEINKVPSRNREEEELPPLLKPSAVLKRKRSSLKAAHSSSVPSPSAAPCRLLTDSGCRVLENSTFARRLIDGRSVAL